MKPLHFTRALTAVLLAMLLAACGGGGGGGDSSPPAAPATPAVPPPPPLKYPIPANLWSVPAGAAPARGNYIYLQSDSGDYVGGGRTYLYTGANALTTVTGNALVINASVQGDQSWYGSFRLPAAAETLQAGYFQNLTRTPFADSAVGGVEWSGEGRGCNTITGWVVIDRITQTNGAVTALDLRFEQHCEGGTSALRGQIHWSAVDEGNSQPPGPAAIPADLWRAGAAVVPDTGNYLYLESLQGDYIGAGRSYLYTQANATLQLNGSNGALDLTVRGDQNWTGNFQGMRGLTTLAVGYYSGLQRFPFNNPVLGGLSWSGDGRGCNTLGGWFAVDRIAYNGTALAAVDLRFEQYCEGSTAPLRGQLHWTAGDTTAAPGPQNPPPATLWKPAPSFVPPAGNYIYLVSDSGDYIGAGRTALLTPADTTIAVTDNLTAAVAISGGWSSDFVAMNSLSQLQPGYYGDLQRYPFHNPVKGGMNWSGNGRGCNTLSGWFVVDSVSYSLGKLTALDLRFEQHCEGNTPALRGIVHWVK